MVGLVNITLSALTTITLSSFTIVLLGGSSTTVNTNNCIPGNVYELLASYISDTISASISAASLTDTNVQFVASLNYITPQVDLIVPTYNTYVLETAILGSTSPYQAVVRSLNQHVIQRSQYLTVDAYITDEQVTVPQIWATISGQVGFPISGGNING